MKMDKRIYFQVLYLFLCCLLDSSNGESINTAEISPTSRGRQKNNIVGAPRMEDPLSRSESPCADCYKKRTKFPKSIAEKIRSSNDVSPLTYNNNTHRSSIVPKESEKIVFSRKYNPDLKLEDQDGFVPVSGPYGTKSRLARGETLKTPHTNRYKSRSESRYTNSVPKLGKNHSPRHAQSIKPPPIVQRRSQYRTPKVHDELFVKESIASENILGNGNFEIIRGGIYSDQDANEILGSRRISRGFGSYVVPTYHQNRYGPTQNVQFPPYYQRRVQNPVHPVFYPRAPY